MNEANFFIDTWTQFFPILPIPVANNCNNGRKVDINAADASLKSVIENKTLRVGVQPLSASYPVLFSRLDSAAVTKTSSSNSSSGIFSNNGLPPNVTLDLKVETLDGFEIACAKEAARRLGELYGTQIEAQFILVSTQSFFDPLLSALESNEIDVIWSHVFVSEERAKLVDYICNTYSTEVVIAASGSAGSRRPDPSGPNVSVACKSILCTFDIPAPFTFVHVESNCSDFCLMDVIANTTSGFNYTIGPFEILRMFYKEDCPNCSEVDIPPITTLYQAPATRKKNMTEPSSRATVIYHFSTKATFVYQSHMLLILFFMIAMVGKFF